MNFLFGFHWSCMAFPSDQVTEKIPLVKGELSVQGLGCSLPWPALLLRPLSKPLLCSVLGKLEQIN